MLTPNDLLHGDEDFEECTCGYDFMIDFMECQCRKQEEEIKNRLEDLE